MKYRKTIIACTVAMVLSGSTSVLAEKAPFEDQIPIEAMPMIEQVPSGFFVDVPMDTNMTVLLVRVYDNRGDLVLDIRSEGEPVMLLATDLLDGEYRFQIKTLYKLETPVGQGAGFEDEVSRRNTGSFTISDGTLYEDSLRDREEASVLDQAINQAGFVASAVMDILIPSAQAQDITISDPTPALSYDDDSTTGPDWAIAGDADSGDLRFRDLLGLNNQTVIDINGEDGVTSNENSMVIDSDGDIHMLDGVLFLGKSKGTLSLGWDTNVADIALSNGSPKVLFHDESDTSEGRLVLNSPLFRIQTRVSDVAAWTTPLAIDVAAPTDSMLIHADGDIQLGQGFYLDSKTTNAFLHLGGNAPGETQFQITGTSPKIFMLKPGAGGVELNGGPVFQINADTDGNGVMDNWNLFRIEIDAPQNSMVIGSTGNIGLGTVLPAESLHIVDSDGTARILVEETNTTAAPRTLFQLKNKGNTKFGVLNTEFGVEWAFANPGTAFRLSRQGSGVVEMEIFNNGNVKIAGALTENSDVNAKTAIMDINPEEILGLVSELPVSQWEYKDARGETHIGPMAQDFYAAFGLGASETGISTIDTAGVALVAIQALVDRNKALETALANKTEALEIAIEELQSADQAKHERVDQLEQMVMQLMQAQENTRVLTSLR